jgi:hypothetical protein
MSEAILEAQAQSCLHRFRIYSLRLAVQTMGFQGSFPGHFSGESLGDTRFGIQHNLSPLVAFDGSLVESGPVGRPVKNIVEVIQWMMASIKDDSREKKITGLLAWGLLGHSLDTGLARLNIGDNN